MFLDNVFECFSDLAIEAVVIDRYAFRYYVECKKLHVLKILNELIRQETYNPDLWYSLHIRDRTPSQLVFWHRVCDEAQVYVAALREVASGITAE